MKTLRPKHYAPPDRSRRREIESAKEQPLHELAQDPEWMQQNLRALCPLCNGQMIRRLSRHGPFFGCARYPHCQGTRDERKAPEPRIPSNPCPQCGEQQRKRRIDGEHFFGCKKRCAMR